MGLYIDGTRISDTRRRHITYSTGVTLTSKSWGRIILVNNTTSAVSMVVPAITANDVVKHVTVGKLGIGTLVIKANGLVSLGNSIAGGFVKNSEARPGACLTLSPISAVSWQFVYGGSYGIWGVY